MERQEVLERFCKLADHVNMHHFEYDVPSDCDYNIALCDQWETPLDSSDNSGTNDEYFDYWAPGGMWLYIRVYAEYGSSDDNYHLYIDYD